MTVLFVYSLQDCQSVQKPLLSFRQIQFGISYISSLLKKHGHATKLLVLTRETKSRTIDEYISDFNPDVICFSIIFSEYEFISDIAAYIKKKYPNIYLLAGGTHVTLNPEKCIAADFNAICIGEGEFPVLELIEKLKNRVTPSKIPNLWIKDNGLIEKNPTRPFLADLDSLPYPDRDMWKHWVTDIKSRYSILVGRGCPFQCTYCCNHALKKTATGEYVRLRSVNNIISEIRDVVRIAPDVAEIFFEVETISANKNFAIELSKELKQLNKTLINPLTFGTNIRVTPNIDLEEMLRLFKECGFRFINIGLESGSERVRTQILKRNYSNNDIIRTADLAKKYGLKVCFQNLIGIPGETLENFKETIKINRRCLPDWNFLNIFFPYPGTDLYTLSLKNGLIDNKLDTRMERCRVVLDMPQFSAKQIEKNYIWFDYNVYKGHEALYKIMARVALAKIKTNDKLAHFYRVLTNHRTFKIIKDSLRKY